MTDPFKHADIYKNEWDLYLNEHAKSIEDVKECFRQKLITKEQLKEGLEFFREKEKRKEQEKNDTERSYNNKG